MQTRLSVRSALLSGAALLATVVVSGHAMALPKGPVDPGDPGIDPTVPTRPPITPQPPVSCSTPTLKDCQDPTYLESACGVRSRDTCGNLVLPGYQAEVRSTGETTPILKGATPGTDRLVTARKLTPVAMPAEKLTFGTFSFATVAQRGRTKPPSSAVAETAPQHPEYEANGKAVGSCAEYAYESLYDSERFSEAAETCGSNAECVYQLSLLPATPGLKATMLERNGTPQSWQPVRSGPYSQFKNSFFADGKAPLTTGASHLTTHPSYASDGAFRAKADAIIAWVNASPKATATSELAWHREMHDRFVANPVSASELASIRSRTEAYGDATTSAAIAKFGITMLEAIIPGQSGQARADSVALLAQYRAQNARALADMANLLFAEWDRPDPTTGALGRGCLDRASVKCDWSPSRFVSRYAGHNRHLLQQRFQECNIATGGGDINRVPAMYRVDTDALAAWIGAQSLPKLGASVIGQRTNDGDQWGDPDWFAAGYSYDAGWQLAAERQASTNRICKLKGNAYATGSANAYAFGQTIPVLDTRHKLSVRESGDVNTFHSHLRVLGEDVYSPVDWSGTAPSMTPVDKTTTKTLAQRTYTKWLTIAAVAVKLQVKAEMRAGAELKATATAATGCNPDNLAYDAAITVRPWIDFHVVPELSVGVAIIQGGVRGDIDVIKVSAPGSAGVKLIGNQNDLTLQLRADSSVDMDLLKGNISIFLESCWPIVGCADLASKQIYAWDGYRFQFPLLGFTKDVKIPVFDAAVRPATTGPIGPIGTLGNAGQLGLN